MHHEAVYIFLQLRFLLFCSDFSDFLPFPPSHLNPVFCFPDGDLKELHLQASLFPLQEELHINILHPGSEVHVIQVRCRIKQFFL